MTATIASITPKFFIFPLPSSVMFPHTTKPLNIFEPRYIKMINDAIDGDVLIALTLADSIRERNFNFAKSFAWVGFQKIASVGRPIVLERRDDHSMLIVLEAIGKIHLGEPIVAGEPYLVYQGQMIEEETEVEEENLFLLNRLNKDFLRWLKVNVDDQLRLAMFLQQLTSHEDKINYMSALMVQDPEAQQQLLEVDDLNERLLLLDFVLNSEKKIQEERFQNFSVTS